MSGYNKEKKERFYLYCKGIIEGGKGRELFNTYKDTLEKITPSDVIEVFHRLTREDYGIETLKQGVNKILHTVYLPLKNHKSLPYSKNGLIDLMIKDNMEMEERLNNIKPLIKELNRDSDKKTKEELKKRFEDLSDFQKHYIVKENTIFPFLEKKSEYSGCTQIMWSFDDDIKGYLKKILLMLDKEFNLKEFNLITGKLFFNMFAISFRENKILFPYLLEIAEEEEMNRMLPEVSELGLPFVKVPEHNIEKKQSEFKDNKGIVNLETGNLTPEEIINIFNHLPVDITYVDENNEVKFFSTPEHRVFPRTKSILGRKVQNCHPPESIDTVNRIIESFRKGEKDKAVFWIWFKERFILIQYFAVRNKNGDYKGVLEVTQDITEIKGLKGEKRLLDWED